MRVFRLCLARWAVAAFSGEGAVRYAGRWHFAGTPAVYTATSRALAALEILVHLEIRHAPPGFVLIPAEVPGGMITKLNAPPPGWDALPAGEAARRAGDAWLRSGDSVALQVPSMVVRGEHNVLLNPLHPDFWRVEKGEPEPFAFDPRLLAARVSPAHRLQGHDGGLAGRGDPGRRSRRPAHCCSGGSDRSMKTGRPSNRSGSCGSSPSPETNATRQKPGAPP